MSRRRQTQNRALEIVQKNQREAARKKVLRNETLTPDECLAFCDLSKPIEFKWRKNVNGKVVSVPKGQVIQDLNRGFNEIKDNQQLNFKDVIDGLTVLQQDIDNVARINFADQRIHYKLLVEIKQSIEELKAETAQNTQYLQNFYLAIGALMILLLVLFWYQE